MELARLSAHPRGPSLFSFSSPLSPSPHRPSAPAHSLFMSAWIASFHYTQLPAHYQTHNCFNNRSPPPPQLSFPWQPTEDREREENNRGRKKKNLNYRGGSAFPWPLVPFKGRETITTTAWVSVRLNWPAKRTPATSPQSNQEVKEIKEGKGKLINLFLITE